MPLGSVLNLVRHQAEKLPTFDDPFPLTEERVNELIESAAHLVRRAALASPEILTMIAERAMRCQSCTILGKHCGSCPACSKGDPRAA